MSKIEEEILQKLKEIGGNKQINIPGSVVSVDEASQTAVVEIDGIDYPDIRLNAIVTEENDNNSFIVPVVKSSVMVSFIENSDTDAFISSFSEIDKLFLNANEIVFNKGILKGLIKIEANVQKLNAIEQSVNALKQVLASWTPMPNDGGAALKTDVGSWAGQQLTETLLVDLENEKIKQ